jgi:hypothetical protein
MNDYPLPSEGGRSEGEAMDRIRRISSGVVAVAVISVLVTVGGAGVKFG